MLYCIVDVLNTTASATILLAMTKSVNDNHAKKFILLKKKQQRGRTRAKTDPRFVEKKYCSLGGMVGFDTLTTTFNHQISKLVIGVKKPHL